MNYGVILAAGIGQRMRNGGLPKQFLKLMGKPIIIYTLEKFEASEEIDQVTVVCHGSYVEHMRRLLELYQIKRSEELWWAAATGRAAFKRGWRPWWSRAAWRKISP